MFHTRALDYEPLVAVVVEMLQGAYACGYIYIILYICVCVLM